MDKRIFTPVIIPKDPVEIDGRMIFPCSKCWRLTETLDFECPENTFAIFSVGISPEVLWNPENEYLSQYKELENALFLQEIFKFCSRCAPEMIQEIFDIVVECSGFSYDDLLAKPDMQNFVPELGHHLTLIEYVVCGFGPGRYFNLQVSRKVYEEVLRKLPKPIIHFHVGGGYCGW